MVTLSRSRISKDAIIDKLTPTPGNALSISVLGNMSLAFNGHDVKLKSRKSRAVLAFVALSESRQETRERLVGLFWSESEEHKARASLRQTLRDLRQSLSEAGYHGLQTEKLAIELDSQSVDIDLLTVIKDAENHRVHPLLLNVPRLAETLLAGFEDIDPEFRVWLLAKRQTFQERLLRGLEAGLVGEIGDVRNKKRVAEAIINLDPTHEEACRYLMQARAAEGDVSGSLRVYKALWDLLDEEYGMEPSAKTQQLVAEIKQGSIEVQSAPVTPPGEAAPSGERAPGAAPPMPFPAQPTRPATKIALVLNLFEMNGVGPDKLHLVPGFRHHLIACLVRFREWIVADNVSQVSFPAGASGLSTVYGIDATAYQLKDTVNVVLTLRDKTTGQYIWSENFELSLENWFEAQQRIVKRIAISLNVQLTTERLMRIAAEPDISLVSYDRWLRGQNLIIGFSPDNWDRATQIFEDTIREAPNFSPAYSSLVQMNNAVHFVHPGVFRDPQTAARTLELARTAVQLDPVDSRAQLCLGWAYAMSKQYFPAEMHMDLAQELNDNDAWTLTSAALFNAFCGRFGDAQRLAADALNASLAPTATQWAYHAMIRFLCSDYAGVVDATDRANDIIKTMPAWRAAALFHLGRQDEAQRESRRFVNVTRLAWRGKERPTEGTIGRWLLHCHPISRPEDWERLRTGVIGAGIPSDPIRHHEW